MSPACVICKKDFVVGDAVVTDKKGHVAHSRCASGQRLPPDVLEEYVKVALHPDTVAPVRAVMLANDEVAAEVERRQIHWLPKGEKLS